MKPKKKPFNLKKQIKIIIGNETAKTKMEICKYINNLIK